LQNKEDCLQNKLNRDTGHTAV